ncbi:hypothetical protein GYMLUDRAFT_248918 [Collybiopsis luxurians FD-317 M1]|uniref:Uncharacterized protein n=1 Tax=Collybiopsis luxurians FD-317 M1 TaxID=944289 RepID=A0A0D0BZ02_9AGAR|nr:hypothetical protein GYMLUDRAFT_248918 [Collybiopsis luxurians FD-317 M1]
MAHTISYIAAPTSTRPLPRLDPASPERTKALVGIITMVVRDREVTFFDMEEFTACLEPQNSAAYHSLHVGLGEQGNTAGTFGKLSIAACGTLSCGKLVAYPYHTWTVKDRRVLVTKYIDWLIRVGNESTLRKMSKNLESIIGASDSDNLCDTLDLHILQALRKSSRSPQKTPSTPSSTPNTQRGRFSGRYSTNESPSFGKLRKRKAATNPSAPTSAKRQRLTGKGKQKTEVIDLTWATPTPDFCAPTIKLLLAQCELIHAAASDLNLMDARVIEAMLRLKDRLGLL